MNSCLQLCAPLRRARHINATLQSGTDPILTPGRTVTAQWCQRDVADPAGSGDGETDAVRFTTQP